MLPHYLVPHYGHVAGGAWHVSLSKSVYNLNWLGKIHKSNMHFGARDMSLKDRRHAGGSGSISGTLWLFEHLWEN